MIRPQFVTHAKPSGIAVQKKQDQGSVVTAEIFDNLLLARQLEGEICLSLIEQYYNQQKVFAITGERAKREYVSINQQDPVTGMVLNDITARKCQFTIGERNWKQTLQQAAAESMMELLQQLAPTSPELVTSLLDVAVELFDLPNKTLILQRIRSVTGMTDPNERPTPEEEAKRQENDQKRAEKERLENELQQEQINKLRAEVQKLKAAAVKDGTETAYAAMQGAQVIATMPAVAPIADEIERTLEPKWVLVVIEAEHLCMSMRGVRKPGASTVTSAVRGLFRDNVATRAEAMRFLGA